MSDFYFLYDGTMFMWDDDKEKINIRKKWKGANYG